MRNITIKEMKQDIKEINELMKKRDSKDYTKFHNLKNKFLHDNGVEYCYIRENALKSEVIIHWCCYARAFALMVENN